MTSPRPLSAVGEIFLDDRGGERAMRVSWHPEADGVVLAVWRENVCTASFRLTVEQIPDLVDVLTRGLAQSYEPTRRASAS